jgi:hypothetical protein
VIVYSISAFLFDLIPLFLIIVGLTWIGDANFEREQNLLTFVKSDQKKLDYNSISEINEINENDNYYEIERDEEIKTVGSIPNHSSQYFYEDDD